MNANKGYSLSFRYFCKFSACIIYTEELKELYLSASGQPHKNEYIKDIGVRYNKNLACIIHSVSTSLTINENLTKQ